MTTFPQVKTTLQQAIDAQHSLQSEDMAFICHAAEVANMADEVLSWTFEEFFGFSFYLFITTDSPYIRKQLGHRLHKFGSRAVLSLIKIASQAQLSCELRAIAAENLQQMPAAVFSIGLINTFQDPKASQLMPVILEAITCRISAGDRDILSQLSQHLPKEIWLFLERRLTKQENSGASYVLDNQHRQSPTRYEAENHRKPNQRQHLSICR